MFELCIIFLVTMILASFVPNKTTGYMQINQPEKNKSIIVFFIIIILSVFIGLRIVYNDTLTYRQEYISMPAFPDFWDKFDFSLGSNPGFSITNAWLKSIGCNVQNFLMIYSIVSNGIFVTFIYKHSTNFAMSLFLYMTTGAYLFNAAAIKQCIATAIALVAVSFFLKNRKFLFVLFVLLAMTFHPYVLVFFITPFVRFIPGTKKTILLFVCAIIVSIILSFSMETILRFTDMLGDNYDENSFSGEGINIFRVLVCNAPSLLVLIFRKDLINQDDNIKRNLFINYTMVNGVIMVVGLFGTANYFARLANFFLIFQSISIPIMLNTINEENRKIIKYIVIIGYICFFLYSNVWGSLVFDNEFGKMTLNRYITEFLFSWS